jgi:hypothetical protein
MNGITRLGVDKSGLEELAQIFTDLFLERKPVAALAAEMASFRSALGEPKYSFDDCPMGQELIKLLVSLE